MAKTIVNNNIKLKSGGGLTNSPTDGLSVDASVYPFFGDGSSGDVVISVDTDLSADMYYNNLTINNGITLNTRGYRVFIKGTFTNNGTIANNGTSAWYNVGGVSYSGSLLGGGNGGNGRVANNKTKGGGGGGGGGVLWIAAYNIAVGGNIFAKGGNGADGFGAADTPGSGQTAGETVTNALVNAAGGAGGGGLAGGAITNVRVISEHSGIILTNFIDPKNAVSLGGGAGGSGGDTYTTTGNYGGGGGGGGTIVVIYHILTVDGTYSVVGGAKGLPSGGAPDNAVAGRDGKIIKLQV